MTETTVEPRSDAIREERFLWEQIEASAILHADETRAAELARGRALITLHAAESLRKHTVPPPLTDVLDEIERLRAKRAPAQASPALISVHELAHAIGRTTGATYRLLDQGHIPGAERISPGTKNSPWLIPEEAAARFLSRHSNGRAE
jgi:hypothetical protein